MSCLVYIVCIFNSVHSVPGWKLSAHTFREKPTWDDGRPSDHFHINASIWRGFTSLLLYEEVEITFTYHRFCKRWHYYEHFRFYIISSRRYHWSSSLHFWLMTPTVASKQTALTSSMVWRITPSTTDVYQLHTQTQDLWTRPDISHLHSRNLATNKLQYLIFYKKILELKTRSLASAA